MKARYFRNSSVTALAAMSLAMAGLAAGDASAQSASTNAVAPATTSQISNPEEVVVTGEVSLANGLMKVQHAPEAVSSITAARIEEQAPNMSPLQLTSTIPGFNFGSTDAYGLAIRNFVSIRGLDQTEIGWLVEGVPAVDPTGYFPYMQTHADNENISDLTVIPGNSRLQDPIINATGGEFIETIRDPSETFGAKGSVSLGSFDSRRFFLRADTGEIGDTGATAFASVSRTSANNYIGPGTSDQTHIDFKTRKDWGGGSTSTLFASYNDLSNARLPLISLATYNTARSTNNFSAIPYLATYPTTGSTNYYDEYRYRRESVLVSNINTLSLSDAATLTVTPYLRYTMTDSPGGTSVNPASAFYGNTQITPVFDPTYLVGGKLFGINNQLNLSYEEGINSTFEYDFSKSNHLTAGYWFDKYDTHQSAVINLVSTSGQPVGVGPNYALRSANGTPVTGTNFQDGTTSHQFFAGDTQAFFDNSLQLTVGAKYMIFDVAGTNYLPGNQTGVAKNIEKFLPRFSVSYDATDELQFYGNVTKSARMPLTIATYYSVYNAGTGVPTINANLAAKPETSLSEQLGMRYNGIVNIDLNVFNTTLQNHQVQSLQPVNGTNVSTVISAGSGLLKGATAEVASQRYFGFSIYANTQYLEAKLKSNISSGTDFLPTAGKSLPLSPKWTDAVGISYDDDDWLFGSVTYKHVGSQYSTFMNDEKMKAFDTLDLGIGARLPSVDFVKKSVLSLNVTNLTAGKYLDAVAGVTLNSNATTGINGTTINAAKPSYYLAAPLAITVSLTADL